MTAAPSRRYCGDPEHNPLFAHRERRRTKAKASGQRAEETGGQPVAFGITRAAELVNALEKLTAQHADTLARAITELRASTQAEVRATRDRAATEIHQARESADRDISAAHDHAARQAADAEARAGQADQDAARARQAGAAAVVRAEHARAAAADEAARIRADHQCALDQLTTATSARITALEETRDALHVRAA